MERLILNDQSRGSMQNTLEKPLVLGTEQDSGRTTSLHTSLEELKQVVWLSVLNLTSFQMEAL